MGGGSEVKGQAVVNIERYQKAQKFMRLSSRDARAIINIPAELRMALLGLSLHKQRLCRRLFVPKTK